MLSIQDHYESTFTDLHIEEQPILLGRYQGIKGIYKLNDDTLSAMANIQTTYTVKFRLSLLQHFKESLQGCTYVGSLTGLEREQWAYNFLYEPKYGLGFIHFGVKLVPDCSVCNVGGLLSCTIYLKFMQDDSITADFFTINLGTSS